ncbi:uncharacterized protein UDID_00818 [Ustilago sp. UG-2017a]|nr:uncharacterized protein UDID_00818 [Ustilago sp. UG-2017a]
MPQQYYYPQTNEELIRHYKLEPHPEGGYYAVTFVMEEKMKSPFASEDEERNIATCIYYLLCHKSPGCPDRPSHTDDSDKPDSFKTWSSDIGVLHLNKSSTMHVHHAVMGGDIAKSEVRQLLVEGGWWKVSEVPEEDREAAENGSADGSRVGALISEVVTPGFHWNDHTYLNQAKLHELFAGCPRAEELYEKYKKYVKEQ